MSEPTVKEITEVVKKIKFKNGCFSFFKKKKLNI
jgi:hypothetical protein